MPNTSLTPEAGGEAPRYAHSVYVQQIVEETANLAKQIEAMTGDIKDPVIRTSLIASILIGTAQTLDGHVFRRPSITSCVLDLCKMWEANSAGTSNNPPNPK